MLTLRSRAVGGVVRVSVLLPEDYYAHPRRNYAVLLLLHGKGGDHKSWPKVGAERTVAGRPLLVVMPDGGVDGWYSDAYGAQSSAPDNPVLAWSAFHLRELVPWIDAHYRTLGGRAHAVAGASMGGYGALSYAVQRPDLFSAAGSFSGVVHPTINYPAGPAYLTGQRVVGDPCVWGDYRAQRAVWEAADPTVQVDRLRGTRLYLAARSGAPFGPYDAAVPGSTYGPTVEHVIWQMTTALHSQLLLRGIPHTAELVQHGGHSWSYWREDLARFLDLAV